MNTLIGPLPKHIYCYVDANEVSDGDGLLPCVWFGLVSHPGRVWGCNVLLECGAVYRNVPPHRIAFTDKAECGWTCHFSQTWNCYGYQWAACEYPFLAGLRCNTVCGISRFNREGEYLFTVAPVGDGYSNDPSQAKEFQFIKLFNGRLTIQPTDRVLFCDASFTTVDPVPKLKRQTAVYSCE